MCRSIVSKKYLASLTILCNLVHCVRHGVEILHASVDRPQPGANEHRSCDTNRNVDETLPGDRERRFSTSKVEILQKDDWRERNAPAVSACGGNLT